MAADVKRSLWVVLFLAAALAAGTSQAAWELIDNFETYTVDDDLDGLSDGTGTWVATPEYFGIEADPTDPTNRVMQPYEVTGPENQAFLDDPKILVADGTVATLFVRFYREEPEAHVNFGLSDVESPTTWADFESQLRDREELLWARDAGAFVAFDDIDTVPVGEWMNFWMVIDNDEDSNEYYLQAPSIFPTQQKLGVGNQDVFNFRNGTDDDLVRFLIRDNNDGAGIHIGPWYLDDIYLDTAGENLTDPTAGVVTQLWAGDADMDLDFDQLDLVKVQIAAKYLTGQAATWGDGDWNGAPGGSPGNPPLGDGTFNQLDIIAALAPAHYLTGPYAAVAANAQMGDAQTSVGYNAGTGEVWVDAPAGKDLTSINIESAGRIFTGDPAQNLGGSFDNDADNNIFKATFGGSFGSLSFGNVAQQGLTEAFLLNDLTVVGSLAGGGSLGNVDLIYVPEPATVLLLALGGLMGLMWRRFWRG